MYHIYISYIIINIHIYIYHYKANNIPLQLWFDLGYTAMCDVTRAHWATFVPWGRLGMICFTTKTAQSYGKMV